METKIEKQSIGSDSSNSEDEEPLATLKKDNLKIKSKDDNEIDKHITNNNDTSESDDDKSLTKLQSSTEEFITSGDDKIDSVAKRKRSDSTAESTASSSKHRRSPEMKKIKRSEKPKSGSRAGNDEDSRILRMKRYVNAAGLRLAYTKLFENCKSVKSKVQKLQDVLEEAGLIGKPTLEKCKRLQKKIEKRRELAELDQQNILTSEKGRTRRSAARNNPFDFPPSRSPTTKTRVAVDNPIKRTFSRLKGIVDSEESSGD